MLATLHVHMSAQRVNSAVQARHQLVTLASKRQRRAREIRVLRRVEAMHGRRLAVHHTVVVREATHEPATVHSDCQHMQLQNYYFTLLHSVPVLYLLQAQ